MIIIDCILIGILAGLIFGIFGGGSGLIMVPGFYYVLNHFAVTNNFTMQFAIATTAAASGLLGLFPTKVQWRAKNIDFFTLKKIFLGILFGTIIAVLCLNIIPSGFIKHLFGFVVIIVAIWFWLYHQESDAQLWSVHTWLSQIAAFILGVLWFLFGIAVFSVPFLHKLGLNIRRAVGSATFMGAVFSGIAAVLLMVTGFFQVKFSINHVGFVNLTLVLFSVIPSAIAAYFGAKISHRLPQHYLKKIYAVLILVVGILMIMAK